jgi:arylsulfatase A-like enzyme
MMVGFPGPHHPYDPTPEYAAQFDPEDMPEPLPPVEEDVALLEKAFGRSLTNLSSSSWYAFKNEREPERKDFMLQRARYTALIKQIDHEVGAILEALREKGIMDNTVIVFSSDHGDYLGDHGLAKKGSFFEGATRVPLLVRVPWAESTTDYQDLVSLKDVTATILSLAGCEVPAYMDSIPLPELGIPVDELRNRVVGMLRQGWMLVRDEWKLAKYGGGGSLLFNLEEDPLEQHNLLQEDGYEEIAAQMDAELTKVIMQSINMGFADRRALADSGSGDPSFGRPGWPRPYPMKIQDLM